MIDVNYRLATEDTEITERNNKMLFTGYSLLCVLDQAYSGIVILIGMTFSVFLCVPLCSLWLQ